MRISGYGAGFGGQDPSKRDRELRREAFRRSCRVGDRVRALLLRHETASLGWVRIEGCELLAEVGEQAQPGQTLYFLVRELIPEIVLQPLSEQESGGLVGAPLSELIRTFLQTRDALEARLQTKTRGLAEAPRSERRRRYFRLLLTDAPALSAWLRVVALVEAMNAAFASRGAGRFRYPPWALPRATGVELLYGGESGQSGLIQAALAFSTRALGRCECRLLCGETQASVRVAIERAEQAPALASALERALPQDVACLGVGRLAQPTGTLLAPFLGRRAAGLAINSRA
jgi:hypothetical protein